MSTHNTRPTQDLLQTTNDRMDVNRIIHLVTARDQKCGIDLLKKNFPDRQWYLFALMELEPESDIFKPLYNPKMVRATAGVIIK